MAHQGTVTTIGAATDTTDLEIASQRVSTFQGVGTLSRFGLIGSNLNWDVTRDYIIQADITLSGIANEELGLFVEGPQTGVGGTGYYFTWGNFSPGNNPIFTVRNTAFQVLNLTYLPALTAITFTARIEFSAATGDWEVYVNNTLRHTVTRPAAVADNAGVAWPSYTSGNHPSGGMNIDNFSLRGFTV